MISAIARCYLDRARFSAARQLHKVAYDMYITAVQLDPQIKVAVEYEFRVALTKYNHNLAFEGNRAQIYDNFIIAMQIYPGNTDLLCGIAKYLVKNALYAEALCHFEKALHIDSNLVDTEKNFDTIKRFLFSRNNFRYLNDDKRKQAYLTTLRAIEQQKNNAAGEPSLKTNNVLNNELAKVSEGIMGKSDIHDLLIMDKQKGQLEIKDLHGGDTVFLMNRFSPGLLKPDFLITFQKSFDAKHLEGRRVTPISAEYYIVGAKCDSFNSRHQLSAAAKELLGIPHYLVHIYTGEQFHGTDIYTYDDLEYMTQDQEVFKIDFNNYGDIVEKYMATSPHTAIIKSNKDGEINVIVGWFNLHLTKDVILTTDPRSPDRTDAWPQAVFFDFVPRPVEESENVCVQFLTHDGKLKLLNDTRHQIKRLSSMAIAFLNDSVYMNAIMGNLELATVHLTQLCDLSLIDIADLCPFPIFGLFMMKRGARSLVCYAPHRIDKEFIECIFGKNKIPLSKITILTTLHWNVVDQLFHAIVYNALKLSGDIEPQLNQVICHLRQSHLVDGGLSFPANVKLIGQLISSNRLDTLNKVKEEGPMSPLAEHINMFQASQAHYLDPFRLEHEQLSDPVVISSNCQDMCPGIITVPVERDGLCNAILCWYEIFFLHDEFISTYRKNSFIETTAFLVKRPIQVHRGDTISVIRCVDVNGSFKLAIDMDIL